MAPIISPIIIPEKQDKNLLILSQKTRQIIQLVIVNINVTGNEEKVKIDKNGIHVTNSKEK